MDVSQYLLEYYFSFIMLSMCRITVKFGIYELSTIPCIIDGRQ